MRQAFRLMRSHYAARPRLSELPASDVVYRFQSGCVIEFDGKPRTFRRATPELQATLDELHFDHVFKCGNCFEADCRYVCRSLLRY